MTYIVAGFPRATAKKTLKVFLCTELCTLCDIHLITSALGKLRINSLVRSKCFKLPSSLRDVIFGNFVKTLKINTNCPRAHVITETN